MYQTIFITLLTFNQLKSNLTFEIEKLSLIYKFNIKKIINNKSGAIIDINIKYLSLLQNNNNIKIIYNNEFYKDIYLNKYLEYKKK